MFRIEVFDTYEIGMLKKFHFLYISWDCLWYMHSKVQIKWQKANYHSNFVILISTLNSYILIISNRFCAKFFLLQKPLCILFVSTIIWLTKMLLIVSDLFSKFVIILIITMNILWITSSNRGIIESIFINKTTD